MANMPGHDYPRRLMLATGPIVGIASGLVLVDMPSLVQPFGEIVFSDIHLRTDGMAIAIGDDIDLAGAGRPFYGCAVIFGITGIGICLVKAVIDIQAIDLGGHADDEIAAGHSFW